MLLEIARLVPTLLVSAWMELNDPSIIDLLYLEPAASNVLAH